MEINRDLAAKVLSVVDAGLVHGMGEPTPGKMCVEAAVCYAMGLPHSDQPTCVSPALRKLKIRLNDSCWSTDAARAKGMRRLAIAQLGSADTLDDVDFTKRVVELVIRTSIPSALRAAASIQKKEEHKIALNAAADRCEAEGTRDAAINAHQIARAAAYAAAAYAAAAAAYAAAAYAAYAAADAATAYAAADAAARDKILSEFAEGVVQILIAMKAPGCEWLDLAPLETVA